MAQAAEVENEYLDMLNPAQRQAATHGQPGESGGFDASPLLVIAGAGTDVVRLLPFLLGFADISQVLFMLLHRLFNHGTSGACMPKLLVQLFEMQRKVIG